MAKEKLPIISKKPCSEQFYKHFCHASTSCDIDCQVCGRTHFVNGNHADYEDGELEKLVQKAKEDPDQYIESTFDSIGWMWSQGKQVVFDCPCNYARFIENLLLEHENDALGLYDELSSGDLDRAKNRRKKVIQTKEKIEKSKK